MNTQLRRASGIAMLAFLLLAGSAGAQGPSSQTSGDVEYTAEVTCTQDTILGPTFGDFGPIQLGGSAFIIDSVALSNVGCHDAKVEARFDTSYNGLFGMTTIANDVLGAHNLTMGTGGGGMFPLQNWGTDVLVGTVPVSGALKLNATLDVPTTQPLGTYAGIVILTFSDAP